MDKMLKLSGYTVSGLDNYPSRESLRVLSAAVVSNRFRQILLSNPRRAIASGYAGETFHMEDSEIDWMSSIRAENLADFARQMGEVPVLAHASMACL